ncbi:hypothetical protein B5V01_07985 [Mesorhizobium erdmanii]|uniref:Uncharacterized protein n=2 Tax=Mesorhizobium TaxID=68287 RepID=A0A3M9X304_9HYPH|nr:MULTISPECIES: hypothetical protein [Mesorhizobium]RNJ42417.1 hypothetical protein DNR46_28945 [Mesorhizobium japonicum]RXT47899.1 hypothetical protein B5V01_07985 [Mesorhizobium erdmanii]
MAKGFQLGDEVTLTATIMKVLPGGVSSVNIPSYNYPFAIDTPQKAKPGDKVEITGFVTRIDVEEGKITVRTDGGGIVTVDREIVAADHVQVTD